MRKRPLRFNALDPCEDPSVDRTSKIGPYQVMDGKPRNPRERTGLDGRGCLGRWGPNHFAHAVVTRWAFTEEGEPVYRDGKRVLQVLCTLASYSHLPSLPEAPCRGQSVPVPAAVAKAFGEEAMLTADMDPAETSAVKAAVDEVFAGRTELYTGYAPDPRNTDNAWVETHAHLYHDDSGAGLGHFSLEVYRPDATMHWEVVSHGLHMYGAHAALLEVVATRLSCYWSSTEEPTVSLPYQVNQVVETNNSVYIPKAPYAPPSEAPSNAHGHGEVTHMESRDPTPPPSRPASPPLAHAHSPVPVATPEETKVDPTPPAPVLEPDPVKEPEPEPKPEPVIKPTANPEDERMATLKRRASLHATAVGSAPPLMRRRSSRIREIDTTARSVDPDSVTSVFDVQFVGAVSTTNPGGTELISACIRELKKVGRTASREDVQLVISATGITIERPHPTMQKNTVVKTVPIAQISFTGVDPTNKKMFAFVSNNPKSQAMLCHVFHCKTRAKPVSDAMTVAFEKAAQLRTDPFAIDRPMPLTEDAEEGFAAAQRFNRRDLKVQMIIGSGQYGQVSIPSPLEHL